MPYGYQWATNLIPVVPITSWKPFPSNDIPELFSYGSLYYHMSTRCKMTSLKDSSESDLDLADF